MGAKKLGIIRRIALMIMKLVNSIYNKSMKLIMYELSLDFDNEMDNILKIIEADALICEYKNT